MLTLSASRREIFLRRFFQILLALEFLFLCYVNLRLTSHILDGDGADLYGHIIEMAEQGTILLPGWKYTTTMELDCVTLLALPLYLLTHRIFGSVGIANILLILLLAAVILRVVKNLGGTDLQGYFSLLLVLLPYDVGMLDYMDMLLFGGSQYIIKVLVPLLLVILLTEKTRTRSGIFFAVLYGFLLFVTSLSSGPYVLLMGLFPLFLYRIFPWCQAGTQADRDKIRRFVFLLLLTLAASLSGFLLQKALGITTRESELHLIRFEDLSTALLAIVSGLLDVLGVYPTTSAVPAFSAAGISSLLKGSFTFLVLGIGGIVLYRAVKKQTRKEAGEALLAVVLPFTILIMCFVDTRYSTGNTYVESRYFLIGMVMLLILAGMKLEPLLERVRIPVIGVSLAVLVAMSALCGSSVVSAAKNSDYCYDLLESINSVDDGTDAQIGSVFVLGDNDTARILRLLDRSRTYAGTTTDAPLQLELSDNYENYNARDHFTQSNLVLLIHGTNLADYLPEETAALYTFVTTTDWFDLYEADTCPFGD